MAKILKKSNKSNFVEAIGIPKFLLKRLDEQDKNLARLEKKLLLLDELTDSNIKSLNSLQLL